MTTTTRDLATLMTTPQEILDDLDEALREVKALEPSLLPTLEKAAAALAAYDRHSKDMGKQLEAENAVLEVQNSYWLLVPAVRDLHDALSDVDRLLTKVRDNPGDFASHEGVTDDGCCTTCGVPVAAGSIHHG